MIGTENDKLPEAAPPAIGDTSGAELRLARAELAKSENAEGNGNGPGKDPAGPARTAQEAAGRGPAGGGKFDEEAVKAELEAITLEQMENRHGSRLLSDDQIEAMRLPDSHPFTDEQRKDRKAGQTAKSGWVKRQLIKRREAWDRGEREAGAARVAQVAPLVTGETPFRMWNKGVAGASIGSAVLAGGLEKFELPGGRYAAAACMAIPEMEFAEQEITKAAPLVEALFVKHPEWRAWFVTSGLAVEWQLVFVLVPMIGMKGAAAWKVFSAAVKPAEEEEAPRPAPGRYVAVVRCSELPEADAVKGSTRAQCGACKSAVWATPDTRKAIDGGMSPLCRECVIGLAAGKAVAA